MKAEVKELSKNRLSKAKETFKEGTTLLEKGLYGGSINRFYYAAFYAARALLAAKELDSSKHSGVIALFHQHFVQTKIVDVEKAKALSRSFEKRQDNDYEDFVSATKEETATLQLQVQRFIEECEGALKQHYDI